MDTMCKAIHFNRVRLCGHVVSEPEFSHMNHGESFSRFFLSIQRLSGQCDCLRVVIPQSQLDTVALQVGDTVTVTGQLRSFNNKSSCGPRLIISVFARQLLRGGTEDLNLIRLSGTICKPPTLRRTPLGREICDVILAVNRRYGRADYLPCICWGAVAQQVSQLCVGSSLSLEGRVQSRTYTKTCEGGCEERTAYEVSVMRPLTADDLFAFSPFS